MPETTIGILQETITSLMAENSELAQKSIEGKNTSRKLTSDIKELQGKFTCFKADAITSLAEACVQTLSNPNRPYQILKIEVVKQTPTCPCMQMLDTDCAGECGFNDFLERQRNRD